MRAHLLLRTLGGVFQVLFHVRQTKQVPCAAVSSPRIVTARSARAREARHGREPAQQQASIVGGASLARSVPISMKASRNSLTSMEPLPSLSHLERMAPACSMVIPTPTFCRQYLPYPKRTEPYCTQRLRMLAQCAVAQRWLGAGSALARL